MVLVKSYRSKEGVNFQLHIWLKICLKFKPMMCGILMPIGIMKVDQQLATAEDSLALAEDSPAQDVVAEDSPA